MNPDLDAVCFFFFLGLSRNLPDSMTIDNHTTSPFHQAHTHTHLKNSGDSTWINGLPLSDYCAIIYGTTKVVQLDRPIARSIRNSLIEPTEYGQHEPRIQQWTADSYDYLRRNRVAWHLIRLPSEILLKWRPTLFSRALIRFS